MRNARPFFVVFFIVVSIVILFLALASENKMVVIQEGNFKMLPLDIALNKYQDSDCGMVIEDLTYASQVISKGGKTWFFHDHGGFVHWLEDKDFKNDVTIWVMSKDTKRWINAKSAFYSLRDKTPMGYGFGAYENKLQGHVDYETMRLRMLRGETMNNPYIQQQLLLKKAQ